MAGSLNKVQLIGRLGRDPEVNNNRDGTRRALLSVATSEQWKDRETGEKQQRTEWHRVVLWDPRKADLAQKYLQKGSLVYIEGELRTRKWKDGEGRERWTTEVTVTAFSGGLELLDRAPAGNGGGAEPAVDAPSLSDDEIPF